MNIEASAPKLDVNQRLPLRHYYRIADNLLRQARIYRSEKNVLELYILLLRFTSLVIDTIPAHNEYKRFSDSQKALLRQRVLEALAELESLKPLVKKALEAPFPVKRNASLEYNKYDPNPAKNRWQTSLQTNWQNTWQGTVRPRDETLSRHSYFTLPSSRKPMLEQPVKVTYPSYIDVSHIEIPSFDQNSISVSSSEPTALPPQYNLVNQLAPPPVPVPVQNVQCLPPTTVADPRPGSPKVSNEKGPKHLYVSPTMMEEFLALARHNTQKNLETCGVLAGFLEKGMFSVTTLIIPKQEATSDSCQTVNEEELFEVQDKRNLFQLGWIHTHPTQTCFMSSIDLHTHYSYQVMLQEAIAIVMAPTDEERSFGIFRLSEPGGMEAIQQCDQRGFHPHDEPANGGSIYDHCSHVYMNPSLRFDIVDLRCGGIDHARRVFDAIDAKDIFSWNLMLSAYAGNGYIREAKLVFDSMPDRDLVSWTSILTAFLKFARMDDAKMVFDAMPEQGIISLTTMLAAYTRIGDLDGAIRIYFQMPFTDSFSSTAIIAVLGRYGNVKEARDIFNLMLHRDIATWNAMLAAYADNRHLHESVRIFTAMPLQDLVSWNSMLSALAQNDRLKSAIALFDAMPERNLVTGNVMLGALGEAGWIDHELALFRGMNARNLITYNTLLNAYARRGTAERARELFERMPERDLGTWTAVIAASGHVDEARRVFESAPQRDLILWNSLLSAIAQEERLDDAQRLFDSMEERDIVSWNAMLSAIAQNGGYDRAREFFEDTMPCHNVISFNAMLTAARGIEETKSLFDRMKAHNLFSWNALLAASAQEGNFQEAKGLFYIMPSKDLASWTTVLSAMIQASQIAQAQDLFEKIPGPRDRVAWTMMLAAYAGTGHLDKAVELFHAMPDVDVVAWTAMLTGFSQNSDLASAVALFHSMPGREMVAWNAMLCAYARNGHLASATRTFHAMPARNVVSWNAMLAAHSSSVELLEPYFMGMVMESAGADETTFACVLAAHAHGGNLQSAVRCLRAMSVDHGWRPKKQQYGCVIGVLGRAGYLADARDLMESMPLEPDLHDWVGLLGACRIHGNKELAASIAQNAVRLGPGWTSRFTCS